MARPKKNNMEYFSHDNGMRNNRKVKAVRARFGLEGYAVFVMLLELLAEADCLAVKWNTIEKELISGDFGITAEALTEMVDYFINIDLIKSIDGWLYSEKLDKRSEQLFSKRTKALSSLRKEKGIYLSETPISDAETVGNDGLSEINPQSKVKESKLKNNTILIDESSAKKISKKNSVEEKQFDPTDLRQKFDEGVLTEEEKMLRAKAFRHRFKEEGEWKRNFAINRKLKTTERVDFALIEFIRTQLVDCDQVYAHTISSAKKYFTNWYDKKYPKTVNAF